MVPVKRLPKRGDCHLLWLRLSDTQMAQSIAFQSVEFGFGKRGAANYLSKEFDHLRRELCQHVSINRRLIFVDRHFYLATDGGCRTRDIFAATVRSAFKEKVTAQIGEPLFAYAREFEPLLCRAVPCFEMFSQPDGQLGQSCRAPQESAELIL